MLVRLLLLLALTVPAWGQAAISGGGGGGPSAGGRRSSTRGGGVHAPRISPGDPDDDRHVDGSKLFTNDTDTTPGGGGSFSFSYLVSTARRGFDLSGSRQDLGLKRTSELLVGAVSLGLTDDIDLTLQGSFSRLADLYPNVSNPSSDAFGSVRGAGFSNASAVARWRFFEDGGGRSAALTAGPMIQAELVPGDHTYDRAPSFTAWQQSLILRQDLDPISIDLELFGNFPVSGNSTSFSQYGFNLGVGFDVIDWLLPIVELNYARVLPAGDTAAESLSASLGFLYKPAPDASLNVGVQRTLSGRNIEDTTTYLVGGSINF